MDTNICLYCEKQLISSNSNTNISNSFCSYACHAKEAAKTHIPAWATPRGSHIQKARAFSTTIRNPKLLFNFCTNNYIGMEPAPSASSSSSSSLTTTGLTHNPSSFSPPSTTHHYRSRSPRRQKRFGLSPRNRSLSSPPDHINISNYYHYYRYSPSARTNRFFHYGIIASTSTTTKFMNNSSNDDEALTPPATTTNNSERKKLLDDHYDH